MIAIVVSITVPIYAETIKTPTFMIGLIGSAGGLAYSLMAFVAGTFYDRKKRIVFASLLLYSFTCALYNFSEEATMLVLIKLLEGLSAALLWSAVEALLADLGGRDLEDTLRRFNLSWSSAVIIGPVIGGSLITAWSIKAPFIFALFISALFAVLSLFILKELNFHNQHIKTNTEQKDLNQKYSIIPGLASILLLSSVDGIIMTFFPAYATRLEISAFNVGLIVFAHGAGRIAVFSQTNVIEAKIGKIGMLWSSSFLLGIASLLTALSSSFPLYICCFVLYGFGTGLAYAASLSIVLRRWETTRGRAAGIFESLLGFGYFLGPLIAGAVSIFSDSAPYYFIFVLSSATLIIQLLLNKKISD